jgi:predicted Zn-dependent peptidase
MRCWNNKFNDIVKLAEKLSPKRKGITPKIIKIIHKNEKKSETRKELQQSNLAIAFHFPKLNDKERYASEIFSTILGEGMSSRLFTEVREKRGLAYSIKTELDMGIKLRISYNFRGHGKDKTEEVINISIEEFKKMKDITEEELNEAKIQAIRKHKNKAGRFSRDSIKSNNRRSKRKCK